MDESCPSQTQGQVYLSSPTRKQRTAKDKEVKPVAWRWLHVQVGGVMARLLEDAGATGARLSLCALGRQVCCCGYWRLS